MTIHNLMNMMNVCSDVEITVFENSRFEHCYYSGKYEECSKHVYNMHVYEFRIDEVKKDEFFDFIKITKVRIYVDLPENC